MDRRQRRQQVGLGVLLEDVSPRTQAESLSRHINILFHSEEYNFGRGHQKMYPSSRLHAIERGKANVHQDHVWLQLLRFLDSL